MSEELVLAPLSNFLLKRRFLLTDHYIREGYTREHPRVFQQDSSHKVMLPLASWQCETLQLWGEQELCCAAWWHRSHIGFVLGKQKICIELGQVKVLWRAPAWCVMAAGAWQLWPTLHSAAVPAAVPVPAAVLESPFDCFHSSLQSPGPVMNLMLPFSIGSPWSSAFFFSPCGSLRDARCPLNKPVGMEAHPRCCNVVILFHFAVSQLKW